MSKERLKESDVLSKIFPPVFPVVQLHLPSFWMSTPSSFSTSELSDPRITGLGSAEADASDGAMSRNNAAIAQVRGDGLFLSASMAIQLHSKEPFPRVSDYDFFHMIKRGSRIKMSC